MNQRSAWTKCDPAQVSPMVGQLMDLYREVYAEPPYLEDDKDADDFVARLEQQRHEPGFELVARWHSGRLVGYIFGFVLRPNSVWWTRLFSAPDPGFDTECLDGGVVYVSELLVASAWRGRGVGRALHDRFLGRRPQRLAALHAHPDARAAQEAYRTWGWRRVGLGCPFPDSPSYHTLVLALHAPPRP